jgi:hypothetical protein
MNTCDRCGLPIYLHFRLPGLVPVGCPARTEAGSCAHQGCTGPVVDHDLGLCLEHRPPPMEAVLEERRVRKSRSRDRYQVAARARLRAGQGGAAGGGDGGAVWS